MAFAVPIFSEGFDGSCEAINAASPANERLAAEKPQLRPRKRKMLRDAPINGLRSYFFPPLHDRDKWVPLECGL